MVSGGVHLWSKVAKLVDIVMDKSNLNGSAYRKDPVQQFLIVINTIARIVASGQ